MSDCMIWPGCRNASGYGLKSYKNKSTLAHRYMWMRHIGPIPEGMCVLHRCDNRPCVNTEHLWLGTNADNVADRVAKNRSNRVTHNSKAARHG